VTGARRPPIWVALPWLAAAFLATICGIGGGLFAVPLLHYGAKLPLRTAVGTSLGLVFVLATTATVAESVRPDSALSLPIASLLVLGSLPGAQLGYRVARRLETAWLKRAFVVVLVVAGLRVLFIRSTATGAVGTELTTLELVLIPFVGFGGGFVAPLLGIGGGLVVVPALFLAFPSVDYLDARANSLAMSIAASAWSVARYVRDGDVHVPSAGLLAVSTALGAIAGVMSVHNPGWAEGARIVMGTILLIVAGRFALDVWRRTPSG
jgi:hypothetical protein